jgi:hypothetical protein
MTSPVASSSSPMATPPVADMNPVLLDAKNIYVSQLTDAVAPYIMRAIAGMYEEAVLAGSSKVLLRFQTKLRDIPQWNSTIVEQHAEAVQAKVPYLGDLIAAAFVAYVKVMSSIKLRDDKPNIRLKLPTNSSFLHKAFVNVARDFYDNPRLGACPGEYQGMRAAVERTINAMLPIQDILRSYLGNAVDDAHTVSPVVHEDGSDVSVADPEDDDDDDDDTSSPSPELFGEQDTQPMQPSVQPSMQQPMQPSVQPSVQQPMQQPMQHPMQQHVQQPMQQPMQPFGGEAHITQCETKTISIPPVRSNDLFEDADDEDTDWAGGSKGH